MKKSAVFIAFWASYILWIFLNNFLQDLKTSLVVFLSIFLIFITFFYLKKKYLFFIFFSLIWLIIWIYISDLNYQKINNKIDFINTIGEKDILEVEIKGLDKINEDNSIYIWKLDKLENVEVKEKIFMQVFLDKNYKLHKWDKIQFKAKIYEFQAFNNFDYDKYMYSKNIFFKVYPYSYEKIWNEKPNLITKNIDKFREKILTNIKEIYPTEESIFLAWVLIWARENISKKLSDNFNNSWLTHIIAVSWFNITILIIFCSYITSFIPSIPRFLLISMIIITFTILVWYNPPVIRAAIMWIIWYFIIISWRKWNSIAIIILTAILMISHSPLSINYDVSLHLSFLAVFWILFFQKPIEKALKFVPNFFEIRTALSITLAALIFTLPVTIFNFWQLSIIAPVSNILVSWTIPIIMLISIIWLIFYNIFPIIWIIISFISWVLLKWDILIVNFFWELKYSVIKYDFWIYSWILELLSLIILFCIIFYINKKSSTKELEDPPVS